MNTLWLARRMGNGAGADISFNANRQVTRSGIPNVIPGGNTVVEALENWFYPSTGMFAMLSIQGGNVRQMGNPDLDVELLFTVNKGDNAIDSILINGSVDLENGSGNTQNGSYNTSVLADTDTAYQLTATDDRGNEVKVSQSLLWKLPNFYGALADDPVTLLDKLSSQAINTLVLNKVLASNKAINHSYDCSGGKYIYICYPAAYGNPVSVKIDQFDFSAYDVADVTITDMFGIDRPYKLMYTGYQTGNPINLNLVN